MDQDWKLDSSASISECGDRLIRHLRSNLKQNLGRAWTDQVFTVLRDFLPLEFRGDVFHKKRKNVPEDKGEFLWDFTVFSPDRRLVLVAESESTTTGKGKHDDLKHDFEKLLYVFAPLRLLICRSRDQKHAQELAASLAEYARGCCRKFNPGSLFILHCCWGDGFFLTFKWQSEGSPETALETLKFEEVPFEGLGN